MAKYIQIDEADYQTLVSLLEYVIEKFKGEDDVLVGYLEEGLSKVLKHMENEEHGDGLASEITEILTCVQSGGSNED